MKKLLILILILVGFVQLSFAQPQFKNSTEAYNYWARRGIIEMVYAYMQDYKKTKSSGLNKPEKEGFEKYKGQFIDNVNLYNSKNIDSIFNLVSSFLKLEKNGWSSCKKNIFQPLKTQLSSRLRLNKNFFLKCKRKIKNENGRETPVLIDFIWNERQGKDVNSRIHWKETADTIINNYEIALARLNSEVAPKQAEKEFSQSEKNPTTNTIIDNTDNPQSSPFSFSQHLMEYPYAISFILISLIIGFFVGRLHVLHKAKREINDVLNNKTDTEDLSYSFSKDVYRLKQNNNKEKELPYKALEDEIETLKARIEKYKKDNIEYIDENKRLKQKLSQNTPDYDLSEYKDNVNTERNSSKTSHETEVQTQDDTNVGTSVENVQRIYFIMPESNGSFQIANGSPLNDGKRYFKIEYKESSNRGELFFLSSERDQRAINRLESYLKPVCDIENISNSAHATKIEVVQSGKVLLINDSWIIEEDNKIKIKLY